MASCVGFTWYLNFVANCVSTATVSRYLLSLYIVIIIVIIIVITSIIIITKCIPPRPSPGTYYPYIIIVCYSCYPCYYYYYVYPIMTI
jgi:hypothetical protein